jgi:hypothetical protein
MVSRIPSQKARPFGLARLGTALLEEILVLAEPPAGDRVDGPLHRGEMSAQPRYRLVTPFMCTLAEGSGRSRAIQARIPWRGERPGVLAEGYRAGAGCSGAGPTRRIPGLARKSSGSSRMKSSW